MEKEEEEEEGEKKQNCNAVLWCSLVCFSEKGIRSEREKEEGVGEEAEVECCVVVYCSMF